MAAAGAVQSVTLRDVLTRIVPGFVVVVAILSVVDPLRRVLFGRESSEVVLSVLLVSYLFGELLEFVRSQLFPAPWPFLRCVDEEFGEEDGESTPGIRRSTGPQFNQREIADDQTVSTVLVSMRDKYGSHNSRDLYNYLLLDIGGEFSTRTVRIQSLYQFWNSIRLAATVAAVIILLGISSFFIRLLFAVVIVGNVGTMIWINTVLDRIAEAYTDLLFKEYRLEYLDDDQGEN